MNVKLLINKKDIDHSKPKDFYYIGSSFISVQMIMPMDVAKVAIRDAKTARRFFGLRAEMTDEQKNAVRTFIERELEKFFEQLDKHIEKHRRYPKRIYFYFSDAVYSGLLPYYYMREIITHAAEQDEKLDAFSADTVDVLTYEETEQVRKEYEEDEEDDDDDDDNNGVYQADDEVVDEIADDDEVISEADVYNNREVMVDDDETNTEFRTIEKLPAQVYEPEFQATDILSLFKSISKAPKLHAVSSSLVPSFQQVSQVSVHLLDHHELTTHYIKKAVSESANQVMKATYSKVA